MNETVTCAIPFFSKDLSRVKKISFTNDLAMAILVLTLFLTASGSAAATKKSVSISLSSDPKEGLVSAVDDEVTLTATIRNRSSDPATFSLQWSHKTVAFELSPSQEQSINLLPGETKTASTTYRFVAPGFVDTECRLVFSQEEALSSKRRVGCLPDQVSVALSKASDFDEFWQESLRDLRRVTLAPLTDEIEGKPESRINTSEISLKSYGEITVRGWLEKPVNATPKKKYPAVIRVPGYGNQSRPSGKWDDMVVFSFNPRGHGNSQDDVPGMPPDYWLRGLDQKENYFYRGAYLDCVRAVDYLCSLDVVDQERIVIWGASQGGGLALATAALDDRIALCVADIPFLVDWVNYFKLTEWPEMDRWIGERKSRTWKKTLRTMSYFDVMNLCERIKRPVFMGVGLQDRICPPTTNFAAYNRITAPKDYIIYPNKGHGLGREHNEAMWSKIREELEVVPRGSPAQ